MVRPVLLAACGALLLGCSSAASGGAGEPVEAGGTQPEGGGTAGHDGGAGTGDGGGSPTGDAGAAEGGAKTDGASSEGSAPGDTCSGSPGGADGGAGCYAITCTTTVHSLQQNRDRLIADLAARKCTDPCTLWAALNEAERYIFLMDTTYFGDVVSRLYPPQDGKLDTALDHAVALYSINGPLAGQGVDGSGRGGNDYNRIYLGFDALAECVMRDFAEANPAQTSGYNTWVKSDDVAGPHAPFTQREMIYWYKAIYDLQSEGPQWHHWHQDSDFSQSGIDVRLGVCGNTDRSLVESTIAFDSFHNSDPLGNYSGRGGYGWQIVGQYSTIDPDWAYEPSGCAVTQPVNTDPYGGGTFAGMGPVQESDGGCSAPVLGDAGCGP